MVDRFLREALKAVVTLGLAAVSMFIGLPLAIVGFFGLYGFVPFTSYYRDSLVVALLALGAAGFIWWLTAMWLAWCGGRLRRYTLRHLLLGMTIAALYMGLITLAASRS